MALPYLPPYKMHPAKQYLIVQEKHSAIAGKRTSRNPAHALCSFPTAAIVIRVCSGIRVSRVAGRIGLQADPVHKARGHLRVCSSTA